MREGHRSQPYVFRQDIHPSIATCHLNYNGNRVHYIDRNSIFYKIPAKASRPLMLHLVAFCNHQGSAKVLLLCCQRSLVHQRCPLSFNPHLIIIQINTAQLPTKINFPLPNIKSILYTHLIIEYAQMLGRRVVKHGWAVEDVKPSQSRDSKEHLSRTGHHRQGT